MKEEREGKKKGRKAWNQGERDRVVEKEGRKEGRRKIQGKFGLLLVASSLTDDWQSVSRLRGRVNVLAGPSLAWSNPGLLPAFHARLSTLYLYIYIPRNHPRSRGLERRPFGPANQPSVISLLTATR